MFRKQRINKYPKNVFDYKVLAEERLSPDQMAKRFGTSKEKVNLAYLISWVKTRFGKLNILFPLPLKDYKKYRLTRDDKVIIKKQIQDSILKKLEDRL